MTCEWDGCDLPVRIRAYASYNVDEGENVHPRHARYPMPMIRACSEHVGWLMMRDADLPGSTRQWLVVCPTDGWFRHRADPEVRPCLPEEQVTDERSLADDLAAVLDQNVEDWRRSPEVDAVLARWREARR